MSDGTGATSRRTFLKQAGIGSLGVVTTLAGCVGDFVGGGSVGGQDLTQVNIILAPDGFQGVMMDYITQDTNILEDAMNEVGYTARVQTSWEGAALFAAGGPDFETLSSLEATRLGVERDIDIAIVGKIAPLFMGWWAEKGGEFDPNENGGSQAVMDKIVDGTERIGVGDWAGGDIPGYTMAIGTAFDYEFSEEGGDFDVITADYFAIPTLIRRGDLAAGGTSPEHGVATHLDANGDPQHVEIFSAARVLDEAGIGIPPLNNLTTTQEFMADHEDAAIAYLQSWHTGMEWLFEDPMGRVLEDRETHFQQLGVENEQQAQYLIDWGINLTLDNEYPLNYRDQEMDDAFIEQDMNFLTRAEEAGFVPSGWEDKMRYYKLPQS